MVLMVSSKKVYASRRIVAEAKRAGLLIQVMEVGELAEKKFRIDIRKYKTLYIRQPYLKASAKYLPQIVKLAKKFKVAGRRVVDAVIAQGRLGLGKWSDYQKLKKFGIPIPKTMKYESRLRQGFDGQAGIRNYGLGYPLVLKWTYGFKGRGVFLIKDKNRLQNLAKKFNKKELLIQEFIPAEFEYKVITVGYKCLPVILKFAVNTKTFRPDFKHYQVLKKNKLPKLVKMAEKASRILGRELAKVDVLESHKRLFVLEVNRFPGLLSFERLTGFNVVKAFIKYLKRT